MTPDLELWGRQAEEELRRWSEQLEADALRLQAEMDATIRSWESHRGAAMTCHSPTGDLIQRGKC